MKDKQRMYDRLIVLLREAMVIHEQEAKEGGLKFNKTKAVVEGAEWALAAELLENGVIVPPCELGEDLYMVVKRNTTSYTFGEGQMQKNNNQHTYIKKTQLTKKNFFKVLDEFGKTAFLTREEAEKNQKI